MSLAVELVLLRSNKIISDGLPLTNFSALACLQCGAMQQFLQATLVLLPYSPDDSTVSQRDCPHWMGLNLMKLEYLATY